MDGPIDMIEKLKYYGVGRRKLDDFLFIHDKPPARFGIYDLDDENLCHEVIKSTCHIPGCTFTTESLLEFENHYNTSHRYCCGECRKVLQSPHLLDLHIQESHDSYFMVMALKKPSYSCYIEECKEKFMNSDERLEHCVTIHKLPRNFRFDQKPKNKSKAKNQKDKTKMDIDNCEQKIFFNNNKQKSFPKYTGRRFSTNKGATSSMSIDDAMSDIRNNLPQ